MAETYLLCDSIFLVLGFPWNGISKVAFSSCNLSRIALKLKYSLAL